MRYLIYTREDKCTHARTHAPWYNELSYRNLSGSETVAVIVLNPQQNSFFSTPPAVSLLCSPVLLESGFAVPEGPCWVTCLCLSSLWITVPLFPTSRTPFTLLWSVLNAAPYRHFILNVSGMSHSLQLGFLLHCLMTYPKLETGHSLKGSMSFSPLPLWSFTQGLPLIIFQEFCHIPITPG